MLVRRVSLSAPELAGFHRQVELVIAVLVLLVHPIEDVRKPADASLAEHEPEAREPIQRAREHDTGEKLGGGNLEHRGAGGAVSQVVFLLHGLVGGLANGIARGVERDRHAAFLRRLPERIPGGMPDGEHGGGHGEVSALEPEPRRAPELSRGRRGIMVGNAREADEAPWIALAEARRPVVVDLVHRLDQLAVQAVYEIYND